MSATAAPRRMPRWIIDNSADPEDAAALWRMTRQQRVDAMWDDQLTGSQLEEWKRHALHEIPLLYASKFSTVKELAFIVIHTDEWLDAAADEQARLIARSNVVQFPVRKESDRVAA